MISPAQRRGNKPEGNDWLIITRTGDAGACDCRNYLSRRAWPYSSNKPPKPHTQSKSLRSTFGVGHVTGWGCWSSGSFGWSCRWNYFRDQTTQDSGGGCSMGRQEIGQEKNSCTNYKYTFLLRVPEWCGRPNGWDKWMALSFWAWMRVQPGPNIMGLFSLTMTLEGCGYTCTSP